MEQKILYDELLEVLKNKLVVLHDKHEENPHNTLQALWHHANGNRVSPISAEKLILPILTLLQIEVLKESIEDRLCGIPLAHITERQHFMGLDYILAKGLYIPRKETELLARTAIDTIQKDLAEVPEVTVLDLCTGIGTVALAIANYCLTTMVYGSDIYESAIDAAIINVQHFNFQKRVSFFNGDMFDPFNSDSFKKKTDIIVSAPPYISSVKVKQMSAEISNHEPTEAFDAGPFGLSIFNKLISVAPDYLCKNGFLIFECGSGQGEFLAKQITRNGSYGEVSKIPDESGEIRVLKARIN